MPGYILPRALPFHGGGDLDNYYKCMIYNILYDSRFFLRTTVGDLRLKSSWSQQALHFPDRCSTNGKMTSSPQKKLRLALALNHGRATRPINITYLGDVGLVLNLRGRKLLVVVEVRTIPCTCEYY